MRLAIFLRFSQQETNARRRLRRTTQLLQPPCIITVAGTSPTTNILVQKAMIYGVGFDQDALADSAPRLTDEEQLQDRTASTGVLEHVTFIGLLELVTACVCQLDNEAGGVLCAIQNLQVFELDFTQCERIIETLAVERRR